MKLPIVTFLACLASPTVGRLSGGVGMHNEEAADETLPVRNLEYANKQPDESLRLEKLAAIDGVAKRISAHRIPGRDLKKADDQGVKAIHVGKILADKANLLARNEGERHLESEGYQKKLETIAAEANSFASQDRNLEALEKLESIPSNEFRDMGSRVHGLAQEKEGRGLEEDVDLDSASCILDTDALIKANPQLEQAIDSYIASADFTEYYDATNDLTYSEITYSAGFEFSLEAACAFAGGHFDENTGLIACSYGTAISLSTRYVSCLANTPECKAKDNFEFLEMALENAGWYCLVDVPSEAPTGAPGVVVSSEDSGSVGSTVTPPSLAANFDACMLETNMMGINNPDLYTANRVYIDSLDGVVDPLTGYINFGYSEDAKAALQSNCTEAEGYFDVNEGTLVCDLPSEFSSTVTATVTGHVNCLANIPACTDKNHYSHLQQALENEGFFNCRVLGVSAPESSPGPSFSTVPNPAPTPAPFSWTTSPFRPAVPAPGPAVTTAMPTPAPTNAATTLAPVFPSTGSCSDDTDVLFFLHDHVFDETLTFIESLEYTVSAGEIYYYYSNDAADDLKDVCDDAGGYFVQAKKSLHCLIDYEGITIETETADYAMCLAPTDACYDYDILDFLELSLSDAGYYDCYID